jgi:hypothetical protein
MMSKASEVGTRHRVGGNEKLLDVIFEAHRGMLMRDFKLALDFFGKIQPSP